MGNFHSAEDISGLVFVPEPWECPRCHKINAPFSLQCDCLGPTVDTFVDANTREKLAENAHNIWSSWMFYLFSKGTLNKDGTWTMPAWAVERWQRQMRTKYADLPESEKESDRTEADRIISIVGNESAHLRPT